MFLMKILIKFSNIFLTNSEKKLSLIRVYSDTPEDTPFGRVDSRIKFYRAILGCITCKQGPLAKTLRQSTKLKGLFNVHIHGAPVKMIKVCN